MSLCARPIDPIDAEALAAGEEPVFSSDAAEHTLGCETCRARVDEAREVAEDLGRWPVEIAAPKLAERVLRLRPFSRRERRDPAIWAGACGLAVGVFLCGLLLLTLPALTAREQLSLGLAAMAPLGMLAKALFTAIGQTMAAAPSGLRGLSEAFRQHQALGLMSIALLLPVCLLLRRTLARARS